ncbi:M64 family metallopeptidase [Actinoallomurus acaciae]|uniref:M64 family metallopeptidase n=1 Tax=Actinoallomurus acaciae TaxID=502577 RepID=A0ABV5YIP5_9ACTN
MLNKEVTFYTSTVANGFVDAAHLFAQQAGEAALRVKIITGPPGSYYTDQRKTGLLGNHRCGAMPIPTYISDRLLTGSRQNAAAWSRAGGHQCREPAVRPLANSGTCGDAGGTYATASGGNAMSSLIMPHEIGHSLGGRQDEYNYYQRGVSGGAYTDGEPDSIHHTLLTERQMRQQRAKWWRWLGETSTTGGVIGRYEGGMYKRQAGHAHPDRQVVDLTGFVRDPAIRSSAAVTQTRTWTVDTRVTTATAGTAPGFTDSTPASTDVGADDVIYAETTHPADSVPAVRWTVDGRRVTTTGNERDLDLRRFHLTSGTHTVTARVVDAGTQSPPLSWKVDAQRPVVAARFSTPAASEGRAKVLDDRFTMKLSPSDDTAGATLAEFQVDGDGWYRYFGWPTDSTAPFLFTPLGTNIDDLYYGKLGRPTRAVAWEEVPPGYGRHTIEYRAVDAAGNIGRTTKVEVILRKSG